ncbi:MAG: NTPase [Nitrospirota bacterium]|nr:MAG: NTPase [Nitrospirota bacterium]
MGNRRHILITGPPGVGKTTCIINAIKGIPRERIAGFYTEEVRERGKRRGFRMMSLDGHEAVLADVNIRSSYKVGRYGVNIEGLNGLLRENRSKFLGSGIVIIDEIGKMECFSEEFVGTVNDVLTSGPMLVATVASKGSGLISEIQERNDVLIYRMVRENRDRIAEEIRDEILRVI